MNGSASRKPKHPRDCFCASLLQGTVRELACGHPFHETCVQRIIQTYEREVRRSQNWKPSCAEYLVDPDRPAADWRMIPKPSCPFCRTEIKKFEGKTYLNYENRYVNTEVPDHIIGEERERMLRVISRKKKRNLVRAQARSRKKSIIQNLQNTE